MQQLKTGHYSCAAYSVVRRQNITNECWELSGKDSRYGEWRTGRSSRLRYREKMVIKPCGARWKEEPVMRIPTVTTCKEYRPRQHSVAVLVGANAGRGVGK